VGVVVLLVGTAAGELDLLGLAVVPALPTADATSGHEPFRLKLFAWVWLRITVDLEDVREAIRKKYINVARSPEGRFKYPVGRAGALAVGYDPALLATVPDEVLSFFCGVGNPFALGAVGPGEAVLDVGCGAGVDVVIASRLVGLTGRVCGIDLVPEMVERARANLKVADAPAEIRVAGVEAIPYEDAAFDLVISNGAFNLSPKKERAFRGVYRVLRPGGRLQFADIALKEELPAEVVGSLDAWSE
jgi:SAM-dependent methyltransferase